jgi:hypothetical protein
MCALHDRYPRYGFDQHKGYATAEHLAAVGRLGPCEIHRTSFRAVAVFFQGNLFSMAESLRTRSYRLYCEAMKLSNTVKRLSDFDYRARRLKREYADVFAARDAAPHIQLVTSVLRNARADLRGGQKG